MSNADIAPGTPVLIDTKAIAYGVVVEAREVDREPGYRVRVPIRVEDLHDPSQPAAFTDVPARLVETDLVNAATILARHYCTATTVALAELLRGDGFSLVNDTLVQHTGEGITLAITTAGTRLTFPQEGATSFGMGVIDMPGDANLQSIARIARGVLATYALDDERAAARAGA